MSYNLYQNGAYQGALGSIYGNPYASGQSYQQQYQQPYNGVEKVSGKDSLYQLPMPPNSTSKPYFDFNGKWFYIVTTDAAGAKNIETFDYNPHVEQQPVQVDSSKFVTRDEYDQLAAVVGSLSEALNGIHGAVQQNGSERGLVDAQGIDAGGHVGGSVGGAKKQP